MWVDKYKDSLPLAYADDTFVTLWAETEADLIVKLQEVGNDILTFFASNELIANAEKTGLLIIRPKKSNDDRLMINLGGENILESLEEKILGVKVQSDLKWDSHINMIKSQLNYRIGVLNRLKSVVGKRELKTIAEGLINSKIRYCLSVFSAEFLRTSDTDSTHKHIHDLQVLQNDTMRIIMNHKRSEHVRIEDMLEEVGFLSVNRTLAYAMLIENWKAINFGVPKLEKVFTSCTSVNRTLRSESSHLVKPTSPEPYAIISSKLWNLSTTKFRTTNLLNIAKKEARDLLSKIPL